MAPTRRRPPPLLVLAASGLVAVVGVGVLLIVIRKCPRDAASSSSSSSSHSDTSSNPRPVAVPSISRASSAAVAPAAPGDRQEPSKDPRKDLPEDLPIWARPPKVTAQPFPEGGRVNPPLPPIKIPPEMLVPLPGANAAPGVIP